VSNVIAVFNAGSSSLKFSLFESAGLSLLYKGKVDKVVTQPVLSIQDANGKQIHQQTGSSAGHKAALQTVLSWISTHTDLKLKVAGHRIVHGGSLFTKPTPLTSQVLTQLKQFIPLAPLHQPHNLHIIEELRDLHPDLLQIACFDTAFHHTQPKLATMFALPRHLHKEGVRRYGFHGLSYEYIASELPKIAGEKAHGKVIVAHLGNGASMCAMEGLKSQATTMGFSTLDGLMMGTRCGTLDAGVVTYLQREKNLSVEQIENLLYEQSGLKGVSRISHDMRELMASDAPEAKEAIDLYCYQAAKHLAALTACLGGLDLLVFTAGIGENQPLIREKICQSLEWMGIRLSPQNNRNNSSLLQENTSQVDVRIIPTNEELVIARHCASIS
jgi:acetate kinase